MNAEVIQTHRQAFTSGKRSEVIKASEELIAEIERLTKRKRLRQGSLFAPSQDEVMAYAKEIGLNSGEPEAFFDHHTARGWKYKSGLPMIDWKAAIRTWKRNSARFNPPVNGNGAKSIGGRYGVA